MSASPPDCGDRPVGETAASPVEAPAPDPRGLLAEYRAVLSSIDDLPRVVWVRRRRGRLGWILRVPRLRLFLRFFVVHHVARSLGALGRLYHSGAAIRPEDASFEAGAAQVESFTKSLPAHRPRLMLVLLVVSVFFASHLIARTLPVDFDPTFVSYVAEEDRRSDVARRLQTIRASAEPLGKMTAAGLTLNPGEVADALRSFACTSPGSGGGESVCTFRRGLTNTVAALILLGVSLWLITALPITSFRLKRLVFNLRGSRPRPLGSEIALEHRMRARGVYRRETELFHGLGARPPREVPLDLLSPAGLLVIPIWVSVLLFAFAGYGILTVTRDGLAEFDLTAIVVILCAALLVSALPGARLVSLQRIHRRRLADAEGVAEEEDPFAERLTGWRRRVGAHLIDSLVAGAIGTAVVVAFASLDAREEVRWLLGFFAAPAVAWGLYAGAVLARPGRHRGQSVGKQLLGLRVVCPNGESPGPARFVFREALLKGFLFGPASVSLLFAPAVLNYAFPVGHHRKCALHDLIADTMVVREATAPAAVPAALAH